MRYAIAEPALQLRGVISYETRRADTGELIPEESGEVRNIVVNVGLDELAKILAKLPFTTGYEIAVGTGTNAPAAGDTGLQTQVFIGSATSVNASGAVLTLKLFLDTTNANGNTLAEVGAKHNSILINRALLSPTISKTSAKTVTIQISITLSR